MAYSLNKQKCFINHNRRSTSKFKERPALKVLLYTTKSDGIGKQLISVLGEVIREGDIEVFHHIDSLMNYFRSPRPADDLTIAVFLASDREDLQQLVAIRDLIINIRIILVLPDRENETIAEGHSLQPRFITYLDSDFEEIGSVMNKMIKSRVCVPADRN